ncbi:hypothetical protein BC332_34772 [Capsicum chinense]|nr:hypothetical protein BC332_34772 [Capsicum chinense]
MLLTHGRIAFSQEIATANDIPTRKAEKKHLKHLRDYQANKELEICHKLKRKSLKPSHFDKMNVHQAYWIFNSQVAAALEFLVEKKGFDKNVRTTAWQLRHVF